MNDLITLLTTLLILSLIVPFLIRLFKTPDFDSFELDVRVLIFPLIVIMSFHTLGFDDAGEWVAMGLISYIFYSFIKDKVDEDKRKRVEILKKENDIYISEDIPY